MRLYTPPHGNNEQMKTLVRAESADAGVGIFDESAGKLTNGQRRLWAFLYSKRVLPPTSRLSSLEGR